MVAYHVRSARRRLGRPQPRTTTIIGAAIAFPLVLSGCGEDPERGPTAVAERIDPTLASPATLALAVARGEIQAAEQGRQARGIEDEILRIEAQVPGFGGLYFDRDAGQVTIVIRTDTDQAQAVSAAREVTSRLAGLPGMPPSLAEDIRVVEGEFSFSELLGWSKTLFPQLLSIEGFLSIDADESTNRVQVRVEHPDAEVAVRQAADGMGVPEGLLRVQRGDRLLAANSLTSRFRPTGGGIQITPFSFGDPPFCTLGWNVTTSQDEEGFLTAAHCAAAQPGNPGEVMFQADVTVADSVGDVLLHPAWDIPDCEDAQGGTWNGPCTDADAMFVLSGEGMKMVARPWSLGTNNQSGSLTIAGWWRSIYYPQYSVIGLNADKVGRTTGWTRGEISATCEKTLVTIAGSPALVRCADRVEDAAVGAGDSGSPVFFSASIDGTLLPLGVLFGGNHTQEAPCSSDCHYVFSPFDAIGFHLLRTFDVGEVKVGVTIAGPSEVQEHQACTWTANVSGGIGSIAYEWRRDDVLVSQTDSYSTLDTGDSAFVLELTVMDSESNSDHDILNVAVQGSGQFQCPD